MRIFPSVSAAIEGGQSDILFGLAEHIRESEPTHKELNGKQLHGYDPVTAFVLRLKLGGLSDGRLRFSNLSAYWGSNVHRKDVRFVKWGKRVFSRLRQVLPEELEFSNGTYKASRAAKDAVVAGKLQIALY